MSSKNTGLARKSLFLLSYNVFGGVLGYITMFFALRFVGQTPWGIYGSALGIAGLLGIIASLGVDAAHIKKVTQKKNKEECLGAYLILKGFLGLLFLLISFGGFYILGNYFGFSFESPYLKMATYIAILAMLLSSISTIFSTLYSVKLNARRAVTPLFIQTLVQDALIIIFAVYYKYYQTIPKEFLGVLFTYAFLIGMFLKLLIFIAWAGKENYKVKLPELSLLKEYIYFSIPLALLGIVGTIQAYTDRTMLQFFWNSTEVGGYFSIQKLSIFIIYMGSSVRFFLYPTQSKYYEKKSENLFKVTLKAERYLSLLSVPFVFFTFVMGSEILNLFNSSLIAYSSALSILMIYAYLNVINGPYSSLMTSANKPNEVMKVGIIQATANVFLNTIFIPSSLLGVPLLGWKSTGAALATLLSFLIGFSYLRYKTRKILKIKYEKRILYHLFSGLLASILVYFINYIFGPFLTWYMILILFGIFVIFYTLPLFLIREIGREDLEMALEIVHLKIKK